MKRLSFALGSTIALAIAASLVEMAVPAQASKGIAWQDSLIQSKDKTTQIWLRYVQIGAELGTPYYCKGLSSLPDDLDIMAESNKQFEKEFGFRADQLVTPKLNPGLPTLIGMIYIFESMKRTCPEVDRFQWLNQTK